MEVENLRRCQGVEMYPRAPPRNYQDHPMYMPAQRGPSNHWYNDNDAWEFDSAPAWRDDVAMMNVNLCSQNPQLQVTRQQIQQQSVLFQGQGREDIRTFNGGRYNGSFDGSLDGSGMSSRNDGYFDRSSSRNGSFDGSFGSARSINHNGSYGNNGPHRYFQGPGSGSW
jgi:hypothetical protein